MPIQVQEIADNLSLSNCVVLLGPKVGKNKQGEPLQAGLIQHLRAQQLSIEEDIDNLYSCDRQTKGRVYSFLKQYYQDNSTPAGIYELLALVPFHLYLSMVPDLLLKQAFTKNNIEHQFRYYVKDQTPEDIVTPTAEMPVVYNLFGCVDNPKSLVLTHADLDSYLFSIITEFRLPTNLKNAIKSATYFVFLGFDFQQWHLKLLFRLLLGFDESKNPIAAAPGGAPDARLRAFFKGQYGFEFVETGSEDYVNSLFEECKGRGLLRTVKERTATPIREEIKELIKQDDVATAIRRLSAFLEDRDESVFGEKGEDKQQVLDDIDALMGRWERNKRMLRKSTITEEASRVEANKIIESVLETMRDLGI